MKILVVDVAAEYGGAISILEQFIVNFENDKDNEYHVLLSTPIYQNTNTVFFHNYPWIKKSHIHRLYFDCFYISRIIKQIKPDRILSLQNKTISCKHIPQDVYFQNILPIADKKFHLWENKNLWTYQNIIGRIYKHSLCHADKIIVQADWIKEKLSQKWSVDFDKIVVEKPKLSENYFQQHKRNDSDITLFYPANTSEYKNHLRLLLALKEIWDGQQQKKPTLILTCSKEELSEQCKKEISCNQYPIVFTGQLSSNSMMETYCKSALIFPSWLETVGLPLMEAKALKSPILAANCEYAHEAIGDYNKVVYFDPFDEKSIAVAIKQYIETRGKGNESTDC